MIKEMSEEELVLINEELLEDIRHELVCIDGWKAFQPNGYINSDKGYTLINNEEYLVDLDFNKLIKRIDRVLK